MQPVVRELPELSLGCSETKRLVRFSIKCPTLLAASFSGIDNRIADSQRQKALETALRDDATYQLAGTPDAKSAGTGCLCCSDYPQSEPNRVRKAYQQLVELRFVDALSQIG